MKIVRINEFKAAEGAALELHQFLLSLVPYITGCDGCISCDVLKHSADESVFVVIEKWQSIEDHQKSIAGFPKDEMQAAMGLFGAPPKGDYYHV